MLRSTLYFHLRPPPKRLQCSKQHFAFLILQACYKFVPFIPLDLFILIKFNEKEKIKLPITQVFSSLLLFLLFYVQIIFTLIFQTRSNLNS